MVRRLQLPCSVQCDPELSLAAALDLPALQASDWTLYRRLTLVADGATIEPNFYPVFSPGSHADQVVDWLRANPVTCT